MALDNNEIIATVYIKNGIIDHLMISPNYQGKGYGKKVTQFAINKALSEGAELIQLGVIEWNKKATNLYKSLEFEIVQTVQIYRQFGDK